jgi:5-methylcytosine-specific restriction endonuclease McrA
MAVFVLDQHHCPLMPCSEKRARLLLGRRRAVVHRLVPFTIRLKDRCVQDSTLQPVALKLDPGSKTTGIALVRIEQTADGQVHHALHLAHLEHRGEAIHRALVQRAGYRRRRRSANLRHRSPRFLNRRRPTGWLPPSLRSRIGNVLTLAQRYQRVVPLTQIEVERVKFDTQLLQNPEIRGVEYQRGTLWGWEVRSYVLEKFHHRCAYCHTITVPLELDHVVPRSRGGTDRVSNLVPACHSCNTEKRTRTAAEWGHLEVQAKAQARFKDAAAVNVTRYALCEALRTLGLPLGTWSGGRTRWNRDRCGIAKDHALDALSVGELARVKTGRGRILQISAQGRGCYQRTNVNDCGFPVSYLMRQKRVRGFQTGDLVRADVPPPRTTAGCHVGRVAVRRSGSFRVGRIDGINATYCRVRQRADGYDYHLADASHQGNLEQTPALPLRIETTGHLR